MPEPDIQQVTAAELLLLPLFADENPEAVEWIASQMTVRSIEAARRNDRIARMYCRDAALGAGKRA